MNHDDESRGMDRISELPRYLIDDILNRLPINDIARMSMLSAKWYHIWSTQPILVLDRRFREGIDYHNVSSSSVTFDFKNIVDKILLQHNGPIVKFVLDISTLGSNIWDVHHWIRYVSNNGVKELTIENSSQFKYTLPSFLSNSGLSHLDITNCAFKMPLPSTSFQNLVRLDLTQINFDPILVYTILEAPLLLTMLLAYCEGLQYLNVSASRLLTLHIIDSHNIDFSFLKAYTELKVLTIVSCDIIKSYESWSKITLTKIICSFPKLARLWCNSPFFKVAVPEVFPKRLGTRLENLLSLDLGLSFADEAQISALIFLLHSAPQLHSIEIEHGLSDQVTEIGMIRVQEYLAEPDCIEEDLKALRKIKLEGFVNTTSERLFMKLMLANCPSLVEVTMTPANSIGPHEIFFFFFEVMKFPRASQNVNIQLE